MSDNRKIHCVIAETILKFRYINHCKSFNQKKNINVTQYLHMLNCQMNIAGWKILENHKILLENFCYYKNVTTKRWNLCLIKKNRIAPNKGHKYVRQTNEANIKHRPKNENQIAYYDTEY